MKCPYCYKRVGDMPNHLRDNLKCHEKHKEKLGLDFLIAYQEYIKKEKNNE